MRPLYCDCWDVIKMLVLAIELAIVRWLFGVSVVGLLSLIGPAVRMLNSLAWLRVSHARLGVWRVYYAEIQFESGTAVQTGRTLTNQCLNRVLWLSL